MGAAPQWRWERAPRIETNIMRVRGWWRGGGTHRLCLTEKPRAKGLKIKK